MQTVRVLWENKATGVRAEWHAAAPHWRVIDSDGSFFQQCDSEGEAIWQAYGRDLVLSNGLLLWHDVDTGACARYQQAAPHWWAGIGNNWTSCDNAENSIGAAQRMAQERREERRATRERHPLQVSADELPELIGVAEHGDVDAQVRLSVAYRTGQGTAQNDARAVHWARCAAEQGNDRGQALLASAYAEGRGVARDAVAAAGWYRRSAEQGNAIAQRQLAIAYINGEGVQRSADEAAKWYQAAAEQGDIVAQIGLGASYYGGDGVVQNYAEAAKWYERAAAYGDPNAQGRLADMYARGIGVSHDKITALMWLLLAGDDVSDDNREIIPAYRAHLTATLAPNDVAEAERRAMAWQPRT
jgi:TPR repeat protein